MRKILLKYTLAAAVCSVCSAEVSAAIYKQHDDGGFDKRCGIYITPVDNRKFDTKKTPIDAVSDSVSSPDSDLYSLAGDVVMVQGNRTLKADYTEYTSSTGEAKALGNVYYKDGNITIERASSAISNLNTEDLEIEDAQFRVHGGRQRGTAQKGNLNRATNEMHFEDAKLTTCPESGETWYLTASSVDVDTDEVFGESWNTVLWFHNVPVFYMPYFNFPIKNQRKTGFLYPVVRYSKSEFWNVRLPFYWNIAPNYDLTYSPTYYQRRGIHHSAEFRYMPHKNHSGTMVFEYIGNDRYYKDKYNTDEGKRWFFSLNHVSKFLDGKLVTGIDYQKAKQGDFNYLNDFSNTDGSTDKLAQRIWAKYNPIKFTTISAEALDYQMLIKTRTSPFRVLPRISVKNFMPFDYFSLNNYLEFANFTHANTYDVTGNYSAKRSHAQTTMKVPFIQKPYFQLDGNFGLAITHYNQNTKGTLNSYYTNTQGFTHLDDSVTRVLPITSVQARLIMDSEFELFGKKISQSFIPIVKYVYIPYRNQDNIGLYDTTYQFEDYFALFEENRYAGLDRFSNENKITFGFTSALSNDVGREFARFTVGQSFYFDKERVGLYPKYADKHDHRSYLTGMADISPNENWFLTAAVIYDAENSSLNRFNSAIEYTDSSLTAQVNYRYTKDGNVTMFTYKKVDLRQVGAHLSLPINDEISIAAGMYYDIEQRRNIDRVLKIRYDSCCWRISAFLEQTNKPDNITKSAHEDTKFGFQFEMKGLATVGSKGLDESMNTSRLPYHRPFTNME